MATGARTPAPGSITAIPTVNTRKNVPMSSTTRALGFKATSTLLSVPVRRMVALTTSVERLDPVCSSASTMTSGCASTIQASRPAAAAGWACRSSPPPAAPTTPPPASVPATRVGTAAPAEGLMSFGRHEWDGRSGTGWTTVLRSSRAPTCGGASLSMAAAREGMEGRCTSGRSPIEDLAPGPSVIASHGPRSR